MKVLISTGQGRLHLIESAKSLLKINVDVSIVTGWIPSKRIPSFIFVILTKLTKNPNLRSGFEKRKISNLDSSKTHTCSFSEFFMNFLFLLSRYKLINRTRASVIGWCFFGVCSRSHINNIDIFHVRSGAGRGGAIKKARKKGLKVVVDHSIAHPQETYNQLLKANNGVDDGIEISLNNIFWQLVLKDCYDADILLVNSEYVKESFVKEGYPDNKIEVVELGVREDFINLKKNWEINGEINLLFTGGFGRRKGAGIIVEAVKILIKNEIPFKLNVLGSLMDDVNLPDWFKNSSQIILHGPVPQDSLKYFFINSDIYVFPSYSEGAAQSLKEAMASGLPVIATKQSGVKIINMHNGILIEDHSAKQLVDAITELSLNFDLRKKVALNAIDEMRTNHKWENYALKMNEIYLKLYNEKK